jgi:hypothetical protein
MKSVEEIHHSFKELFEATEVGSLPFNQILEKQKGAGETSTFISIPIKRNARRLPSKSNKSNIFKELLNPNLESISLPQVSYAYLNFEKALIPHILLTNTEDSSKTINLLLEHEKQLKLDDYYGEIHANHSNSTLQDKLVLSHFPSDSQWYAMNQLRIHAGCPERSLGGIEKLTSYYSFKIDIMRNCNIWNLSFLLKRVKFKSDLFGLRVGFQTNLVFFFNQVITHCIQYEKASVLFNIASIYSQLGAVERLWSVDGKKRASIYFQQAAGILIYIRDVLTQRFKISVDPNADLHESTLSAMATLMLAQAAECFYEKANDSESTSMLTAVVAIYVSDLYDVTLKPMKLCSTFLRQKVPKKILFHIKTKNQLYAAIAQFHTKAVTSIDRAVAERLARRTIGKRLITLALGYAQEVGGILYEHVKGYTESFTTALLALEAANLELINETPFDERLLAPLRRPPEALVNPVEPKHILDMISRTPDALEGLISSSQHLGLQEVLCESRRLAHDGKVKLNALIEHYGKPLPLLGPFPTDKMNESLFTKVRADYQRMVEQLQQFRLLNSSFSCQNLISCLSKIDNYTVCNIKESHDIVKKLINDSIGDGSSFSTLKSILVTVNDKQMEQMENSKKVQEYVEYFSKNLVDFDIESWTKDKMNALVNLSRSNPHLFSELCSKWTTIGANIEKEKLSMNDLLKNCHTLLETLQNLPNTAWTFDKTSSMSELIRNRKDYMNELDKRCGNVASLFEESIKKIKDEESTVNHILKVLDGLAEETEIVENFHGLIHSAIGFHQNMQNEILRFLHLRNQSCRLLYMCLDLNHQDLEEYLKTSTIRDPQLLTVIRTPGQHESEKLAASKDSISLETLISLLQISHILPLGHGIERDESFRNFWKSIHSLSLKNSPVRRPGVIEEQDQLDHIPINHEEELFDAKNIYDLESGQRRPTQILSRRLPSSNQEHTTVHFERETAKKSANMDGLFSSIWKAKDAFMNLVGKKQLPSEQSRKNSRNPFQTGQSRKSSHSSAFELSQLDSSEKVSDTQHESDAVIKRVMRENSRLRAEVMHIRQDLNKDKDHKLYALEKRLLDLERKKKPKIERNQIKTHQWLSENQKLVLSPNSSCSGLNGSPSPGTESSSDRLNRVTSIATAVVAGINAVEALNRKSKNRSNLNVRMAYNATENNFSEVELKKGLKKRNFSRDDSGIGRSNRTSNEEISLTQKCN